MSGSSAAGRSVIVLAPSPEGRAALFGEPSETRLLRTFARAGAAPRSAASGSPLSLHGGALTLIVRGDAVVDERVAKALLASEALLLISGAAPRAEPIAAVVPGERAAEAAAWLAGAAPPADIPQRSAAALVPAYTPELRKLAPPFLRLVHPANAAEIERALFDASYKGVTDFVTKYAWPPLAFRVVRLCARLGVTPNVVTLLSWLLVAYAAHAFWTHAFGLGLAAAWAMTFLDTVDGKLARVTQRSSALGHWLDHGLDIAHPPVWWAAWALGIDLALSSPAALVVVGGYVAGRLLEGAFMLACGFETHSWRKVDSFFRLITARRNPNLVLLTLCTLAGSPALGFTAVAWWTGLSLAFHGARLAQALALRAAGRTLRPWEEEAALSAAAR